MYNLLISYDWDDWEGKPFILNEGRFGEHTEKEIINKYKSLAMTDIEEIKKFPCIFAYEPHGWKEGEQKDPKFGFITYILKRQGQIKIEYEIIELEKLLTYRELEEMSLELDINKDRWELTRSHWAIKNVDLYEELKRKNITLQKLTLKQKKIVDITKHNFDVALSFPGEFRKYVKQVADELEIKLGSNTYFYDKNYQAQLSRPNLDTLLQDIYRNRAKLVVVFLCEKYEEKEWCGIEFRAIREIINKKQDEKIMYIKMDEGKVKGVFETDGYHDGREHSPAEIAEFINERLHFLSPNEPDT